MLPAGLSGCVRPVETQYHQLYTVPAFTLIELLVVIAIILILISIALPNFLEAQVHAQVTKVKGEIHGMGTALEMYFQDYQIYPPRQTRFPKLSQKWMGLNRLTTPNPYMRFLPRDPFLNSTGLAAFSPTYQFDGIEKGCKIEGVSRWWSTHCLETWVLYSCGPDHLDNEFVATRPHYSLDEESTESYSPTNGTMSVGDIFLWGGDPFWIGFHQDVTEPLMRNDHCAVTLWSGHKRVDGIDYMHQMPPSLR